MAETPVLSAGTSRTIVLGLGNPILSDDGIGVYIADRLRCHFPSVTVETTACAGFHLLDFILDYDHAVIIDSIVTHRHPPGSVLVFDAADFAHYDPFSIHSTDLISAMEIWKKYHLPVPKKVTFIGIEVNDTTTFGENFSGEVDRLRNEILESVKEKVQHVLEE